MALRQLKKRGHQPITRNFRCKTGEIDLITLSPEKHLVFTEVKTRRKDSDWHPIYSVGKKKMKRIKSAAAFFMLKKPEYRIYQPRFDIVIVRLEGTDDRFEHIENAF